MLYREVGPLQCRVAVGVCEGFLKRFATFSGSAGSLSQQGAVSYYNGVGATNLVGYYYRSTGVANANNNGNRENQFQHLAAFERRLSDERKFYAQELKVRELEYFSHLPAGSWGQLRVGNRCFLKRKGGRVVKVRNVVSELVPRRGVQICAKCSFSARMTLYSKNLFYAGAKSRAYAVLRSSGDSTKLVLEICE